MSVTAQVAGSGLPAVNDDRYVTVNAGTTANVVNPGDFVAYSGQAAVSVSDDVAYWKASGIGVALDRNPAYDPAGRQVVNSALLVATRGIFRVSAGFSGRVNLGVLAFPDTTGSAVNAPSGVTGVGAVWGTANPSTVSGGTAANAGKGVAQVIGSYPELGAAGTGQLDIRLWPRNGDFY